METNAAGAWRGTWKAELGMRVNGKSVEPARAEIQAELACLRKNAKKVAESRCSQAPLPT